SQLLSILTAAQFLLFLFNLWRFWFLLVHTQLECLINVVMSLEGHTVTLSCKYSGSVLNLYWYHQKSGSHPQLLIDEHSEKIEKLKFRKDQNKSDFYLEISSAAVSDSAVYYCAVRPTVTGNSKTL
uniref:Ig-like domain-containing protein n=1 Tax=Haplochromis burtoni TaxID=8153 RepID=A0A3Q2WV66_HAPBU